MPVTALKHFVEDIGRARALLVHADGLPTVGASERLLRSDLFRSAWMFTIGALDAYFCDAYTDLITGTLSSKSRQPSIMLPEFVHEIRFPIRAILEDYGKSNWRWRMAARKLMERENVLSLEQIKRLFNRFFRKGNKFFHDVLHEWISHSARSNRLFAVTAAKYSVMLPSNQHEARQQAIEQLEDRFEELFQRRHDCIHNCDRPKVAPQRLDSSGTVLKVIQDVEFFVNRCDEHINAEFAIFLREIGCTPTTIAMAGY